MVKYEGSRDPRFVAVHRGGLLDLPTHRLLAQWAADCAEHVLPLFTASIRMMTVPSGNRDCPCVVSRSSDCHRSPGGSVRRPRGSQNALDPAARAVARAAGHAVATAHMADHELGAAAYAIRAVRLASQHPMLWRQASANASGSANSSRKLSGSSCSPTKSSAIKSSGQFSAVKSLIWQDNFRRKENTTMRKLKLQVQMTVDGYIAGLIAKWTLWCGIGMMN